MLREIVITTGAFRPPDKPVVSKAIHSVCLLPCVTYKALPSDLLYIPFLTNDPHENSTAGFSSPAVLSLCVQLYGAAPVAAFQNPHEFLSGNGLIFVQVFGQLVQLVDVVRQNLKRLVVLFTHDLDNLLVNARLCFG